VGHTPFGHVGERFLSLLMNGCYNNDIRVFNKDIPDKERGFKHNWQSLRVVSSLEKHRRDYAKDGLNLTNFTLWGILNHTGKEHKRCCYENIGIEDIEASSKCGYLKKNNACKFNGIHSLGFYEQYKSNLNISDCWSFEALVVEIADEIAQRHHDLEDGIEANIIEKNQIIERIEEWFIDFLDNDRSLIQNIKDEKDKSFYMPLINHLLVNLLVRQIIRNSRENLRKIMVKENIKTSEDFCEYRKGLSAESYTNVINYNEEFQKREEGLKEYLYGIIINSSLAQKMDGKSNFLLSKLAKAYITNPQQLPDSTIHTLFKNIIERFDDKTYKNDTEKMEELHKIEKYEFEEKETGLLRITLNKLHKSNLSIYECALLRTICDYIAGMTDQFATEQYEMLYGSKIKR
jgi:dGTPase